MNRSFFFRLFLYLLKVRLIYKLVFRLVLIKNPHEIEFELLTSGNAGVWLAKTPAILQKWNNQVMFVQFLDGNTGNCSPLNLRMTSLPVILNHWDDEHWRTDWDLELNVSEIQLVLNPNWSSFVSRHLLVMRKN